MALSAEDYLEGALLRLREAKALYGSGRSDEGHEGAPNWVGSIYLAGRAVEALLRCLVLQQGKPLETGHDLRALLEQAAEILPSDASGPMSIKAAVNVIAAIWRNDLRFTGEARMRRLLAAAGRDKKIAGRRVMGDPLKANANAVKSACERIIARGEPLCRRSRKN